MAKEKIIGIDYQLIDEINELRGKYNYQKIKKEIGEERLKDFISSIYPKFSITEIEKITGIPDSTLAYWFEQLGIPFIRSFITIRALPGDKDDEIIVQSGARVNKVVTIRVTPQLAYIIGFSLGDGCVQRYIVEVFNKDRALKDYLFGILEPYGILTQDERENGLWRLRLSSVRIANLIRDENGMREDTLNYIFKRDNLAKYFIAGFWDAEGSVLKQTRDKRKDYFHIYLYNSNRVILNRVYNFLKSKGINNSISIVSGPSVKKRSYYYNGIPITTKKDISRLSIPKSSLKKWVTEIGLYLNHSKKKEVIKEILEAK